MGRYTIKRFAPDSKPKDLFIGQWHNGPSVLNDFKPCPDDR